MPHVTTTAGDDLFYREECFVPPWSSPPAVLLLHAEAESNLAWYGWIPRLGARARVIRPDMRGTGESVAMRPGQAWSLDRLAADVVALMDGIGLEDAHVVAARFAAPVAMRLAASYPDRVATLALCSASPDPEAQYGARAAGWIDLIAREGMDAWAVEVVAERLGPAADPRMLEGWAALLGTADRATLLGLLGSLRAFDATADLGRILCPTLVATTDAGPALPLEVTVAWQRRIAQSELLVLTGGGDHVAASHARELATAVQNFQRKAAAAEKMERKAARRAGRGAGGPPAVAAELVLPGDPRVVQLATRPRRKD